MRLWGEVDCDDVSSALASRGELHWDSLATRKSAKQAIVSALEDVKKAIPGAQPVEAGPDFVGLSDVAVMVGMLPHAATFPAPVHEGSAAILHFAAVLHQFRGKGGYNNNQEEIDVAHVAMQVNLVKAADRLEPRYNGWYECWLRNYDRAPYSLRLSSPTTCPRPPARTLFLKSIADSPVVITRVLFARRLRRQRTTRGPFIAHPKPGTSRFLASNVYYSRVREMRDAPSAFCTRVVDTDTSAISFYMEVFLTQTHS
jgi:hypothetical protein